MACLGLGPVCLFGSSVLVESVTGVGALRPVESPELGPVCINYTTHCSGSDGFR